MYILLSAWGFNFQLPLIRFSTIYDRERERVRESAFRLSECEKYKLKALAWFSLGKGCENVHGFSLLFQISSWSSLMRAKHDQQRCFCEDLWKLETEKMHELWSCWTLIKACMWKLKKKNIIDGNQKHKCMTSASLKYNCSRHLKGSTSISGGKKHTVV